MMNLPRIVKLTKDVEIQGSEHTIVQCLGAIESLNELLEDHFRGAKKAKSLLERLAAIAQRVADGEKMSAESFAPEAALPTPLGRDNGKFYALKKLPIRAYIWKSKRFPSRYFISHYVYKDYGKLRDQDIKRVGDNWMRVEVENHER